MHLLTTYADTSDGRDDAVLAHRAIEDGLVDVAESIVAAIVRASLRDDPSFDWVGFVESFGLDPFAS